MLSPDQEVGASDALLLDSLSEETFLANLQHRFKRDQIYTYIGEVVVSVNPYKKLALYTSEVIEAYQRCCVHDLPPHIYAAADASFRAMKDRNLDQSVIITGESGSGKTEACKCVMQYLAMVSGYSSDLDCIKEQLLQLNFILEAFGNAKTHRNDNSSRFGKYMEIEFDFKGCPVGGSVTNYLLEKSRVITQAQGERNFHIFYQLLSGADVHLLKNLKLQRNAERYEFLHDSRCLHEDGVDDRATFHTTKRALEMLGFSSEEVLWTFQVTSSVLKLGNVHFLPRSNMDGTENCSLSNEYEVYEISELLQGDVSALEAALTQRTVETRHDTIITDLSATEANYARNALCKALYSRLFNWLVNKINDTIRAKRIGKRKCIGILDIYGFEVLEFNSFEQLIINYCNEKLQQVLIELTLKSEQEEYIKEGIQWEHIDYFNNAVICDLIEKNNAGILSLLDDECLRPGPASDETFLAKLTHACRDNPYFESRSFDSTLPKLSFRVRHYAGAVTYSVSGFVDKNNDIMHRDLSQVMFRTEQPLLKTLFPEGNPKRTPLKRPSTTATQFRVSLGALLKSVQGRVPLYVRCIKPNELKQPMIFERDLVQHQVRYLGLLETARLRRSGWAHRQDYESFLNRYKMLSAATWPQWAGLPVEGVTHLLRDLPFRPHEYCFGRTRVFLKQTRTLYELEQFREESLHELATLIQKLYRGWVRRRLFLRMRRSQALLAHNYHAWKRRRYLVWLSRHLPSESPLCRDWPSSPRCLHDTSYHLRKLYHKWRCQKYRLRFDQTARNRMREKVTGSLLFKDRKASYPKSVSHPFRGDYVRLRHNVKWKKMAAETGDQYVVFADIVNKIARASGKCLQTLLVVSTSSLLVLDQRTLQVKYRVPAHDIYRVSLSPFSDDLAVFHLKTTSEATRKGDFLFETGHVIEIVTKLFLVVQNATGKPPEINIATEFEANFGKEIVVLSFRCGGGSEAGQVRISRRGARMEILL